MLGPIYSGVGGVEPGESENDIFLATTHNVREMFLSNSFNVCVEGASVPDCTSFVSGLGHIVDHDGESKFFG